MSGLCAFLFFFFFVKAVLVLTSCGSCVAAFFFLFYSILLFFKKIQNCMNFIGNGVVVHIPTMIKELDALKKFDPNALERLFISSRAHMLFDSHQAVDGMLEAEKDGKAIGTTRRGIGPCYASKATRNGIR